MYMIYIYIYIHNVPYTQQKQQLWKEYQRTRKKKDDFIDRFSRITYISRTLLLNHDCIFTSYSQCVNCVDCRVMWYKLPNSCILIVFCHFISLLIDYWFNIYDINIRHPPPLPPLFILKTACPWRNWKKNIWIKKQNTKTKKIACVYFPS